MYPGDAIGRGTELTILMAHHGCERLIARAIDSLRAQTFQDWTLVVIDDGSADPEPLRAILSQLAEPRLIALRTSRNVGQYRIYNRLLPDIASPYLAFHDADDWSAPSRLETMLIRMRRSGCAVLGSWLVQVDESGVPLAALRPPENVNQALSWRCRGGVIYGATALCRTDFVHRLGGYDGTTRFGADTDLIYRAVFRGAVHNHPEALYYYTLRAGSLTQSSQTGFGSPSRRAYARCIRRRFYANLLRYRLGRLSDTHLLAAGNDVAFNLMPLE